MVGPLIVTGSNGPMWSHTQVLERIGDAMRLCGSTCASGLAPSMGRSFPRRWWRRYAEADLSRHVSEDVPSLRVVGLGRPSAYGRVRHARSHEMLQMPRSARTAATILVAWTRSLAIS